MTTATELKDRILSRAAEDDEFRALLIADPKAAISAEIGADIPDVFNVAVLEDSATTFHLVLPPSPQLTEAELEMVAGGGRLDRLGDPRLAMELDHDHSNRTEGPDSEEGG